MKRSSGILLSVSSLPSKYGIGCFDESAYRFVDFLADAKQSFWQILPLGPTGFGDSPYQSFSTFAGNPYYIDLGALVKDGLLTYKDCNNADFGANPHRADYEKLYLNRFMLLKKAFRNSDIENNAQFKDFCAKNNTWLEDFALFMALKEKFGGEHYIRWHKDIRLREKSAIEKYTDLLLKQMNFYKFVQFCFFEQWARLKSYANKKNIKIIGDIPIYVAGDSADIWANPQLFCLDSDNIPTAVAGCPPDGFSENGQLWGNPLYNWATHKSTEYQWWIRRLEHCFMLYDVVRIDHFRGFDEYYSIPFGSKDAKNGHWEKGPGIELFKMVEKALGKRDIIAEDLGFVTESVKQLVSSSGFANMKVLEFAFDSRDSSNREDYLPHNYKRNCVAYTGTHDNQTIFSWFKTVSDNERQMARDYLHDRYTPDDELYKSFIALAMQSIADVCIIPMQDWLGLDDGARMNTPGTVGENWKWRMTCNDINRKLCDEICHMTTIYGR